MWEERGDIERIVDPSLAKEISKASVLPQILAVFLIALRCTEKNSGQRPTTRDVVENILAS